MLVGTRVFLILVAWGTSCEKHFTTFTLAARSIFRVGSIKTPASQIGFQTQFFKDVWREVWLEALVRATASESQRTKITSRLVFQR